MDREKKARVYYQNIVFAVCRCLDKIDGRAADAGIGCGTLEQPSNQVQLRMEFLVKQIELLRARPEGLSVAAAADAAKAMRVAVLAEMTGLQSDSKAPAFRTITGEPTTATDGKRLLWYSANCSYWTDDWSKVRPRGKVGIPCCPKCGSPGLQIEAAEWDAGAKRFEAEGNEGYAAFVDRSKETCSGDGVPFTSTWERFKAELAAERNKLHEFDSSLTCNYCGVASDKTAFGEYCPRRLELTAEKLKGLARQTGDSPIRKDGGGRSA